MDEKAPEDAKAAKLFQVFPAEPMPCTRQFLALLQVTDSHIQALAPKGKAANANTAPRSGIAILPA